MDERKQGVDVQCVVCKDVKFIDRAEAARLTADQSIPMCDKCYMPMVVKKAYACPSTKG